MALATLSIDIVAKLAGLEQGMDKAGRIAERSAAQIEDRWNKVGSAIVTGLSAFVGAMLVEKFRQLTSEVIAGLDAFNDLSDATGASVENISALEDVALRTGTSFDTMASALVKFNKELSLASDPKSDAAAVFKALGLSVKELKELDPAVALQQTAAALGEFAADGDKARAVQVLFGKSVQEAAPFLKDLAEAGALQAKVSAAQAQAAETLSNTLAGLKKSGLDTSRAIAGPLVDSLNDFFKAMSDLGGEGGTGTGTFIGKVLVLPLQMVVLVASDVAFTLRGVGREIGGIAAQAAALLRGSWAGAVAIRSEMLADAESDRKRLDEFQARVAGTTSLAEDAQRKLEDRGFNPGGGKPKLAIPIATPGKVDTKAFEDYQQSLTKTVAGLVEKSDVVRLAEVNAQLTRLQELAAAGLDPKIVEQVQRMLSPALGPNAGPQISDDMKRVNELLSQTDSAKLKKAGEDAALLRAELGKITAGTPRWYELTDALMTVETSIDEMVGSMPKITDALGDLTKQTKATLEGAIGNTLSLAMRGEFSSIGEMWRSLLIEMASRAIAADLTKALFGNAETSGLIIKALGWLLSAKGNAFDSSGVIPFATGGIVTKATPFAFGSGSLGIMGEAGPEAILPLRRGKGGAMGVASSGGGVTIQQTINVQTGVSRNEMMQAGEAIRNSTIAEVRDLMRRGSLAVA
jgi:hypothetical protein